MGKLEVLLHLDAKITIAFAHIVFNLAATFILFWFRNYIAKLACKIFKSIEETNPIYIGLKDHSLIKKSTNLALEFSGKAIDYMSNITREFIKLSYDYSFEYIPSGSDLAEKYERELNLLDKMIHDYLIRITQEGVDKMESNVLSKYLDTVKDLERIGDHCTNICEFFTSRYSEKLTLSKEGANDLRTMFDSLLMMVNLSTDAISTWNKDEAKKVIDEEPKVDAYEELYRKKHIVRINEGKCAISEYDYYVEILSNLERIGDHADNIANNVINDEYLETEVYKH
jgi:phosphate:Na+ symporter